MIFTTHDTSLLSDPALFRRDQIWIVEKDTDQATKLASLAEFSVRKNEAIERGYLVGRYGGVPFPRSQSWGEALVVRENSPKERQKWQLERKIKCRASYDRILIVSEGSKTEPNYFKEIRKEFRLPTANVQVHPSDFGTDPLNVVKYARELFKKGDRRKGIQPRAFEKVFAVFDRDDHLNYFDALGLADSLNGRLKNNIKQPIEFHAIVSIPCFELWLLLHYEDIQAPIHRDEVLSRLKRQIPRYEKGAENTFAITRDLLSIASLRASTLAARSNAYDGLEPFTAVAELVHLLVNLRTDLLAAKS